MFTDIALTVFLLLANKYSFLVKEADIFSSFVDHVAANRIVLFSSSALFAIVLVILCFFFENIGLYKVGYFVSKILYRVSKFLIFFLSCLHVWLWYILGENLFMNGGYLVMTLLFILLTAACFSIRILDFNYNFLNTIVHSLTVVIAAIVFVELLGPQIF